MSRQPIIIRHNDRIFMQIFVKDTNIVGHFVKDHTIRRTVAGTTLRYVMKYLIDSLIEDAYGYAVQ